jgi:hypothetical protein
MWWGTIAVGPFAMILLDVLVKAIDQFAAVVVPAVCDERMSHDRGGIRPGYAAAI